MGSVIPQALTFNCTPKSTTEFLAEVSMMSSVSEKISKIDDYVNRLQEEMKKIDAFKRELPLCMILLNDAIAIMKEEMMRCKINSNCKPVLEEFIPLKKSSSDEKEDKIDDVTEIDNVNKREKMNWMSSVQLGNSSDNSKKRKEEAVDRPAVSEFSRSGKIRSAGKAFSPFKGCGNFLELTVGKEISDEFPAVTPSLSLRTPEIKNSTADIFPNGFSSKSSSSRSGSSCGTNSQSSFKADSQHSGRKQRRCWSPELHRRFVSALQQLGGAQAATPKQIRDLMQVDGLTNDEVKSHLQKYRLHTRRAPPTSAAASTNIEGGGGSVVRSAQEQCGESSKPSNSHSSSPQGPLHILRGTSVTVDEEDEEEEDRSERENHVYRERNREFLQIQSGR